VSLARTHQREAEAPFSAPCGLAASSSILVRLISLVQIGELARRLHATKKHLAGWQTTQSGRENKVIIHHSKSLYESLLSRSHCVVCHPARGRFCAKNGPFCHFHCNIWHLVNIYHHTNLCLCCLFLLLTHLLLQNFRDSKIRGQERPRVLDF